MRRREGTTLLEVLVASFILGLLLMVIYKLFIPAFNYCFKADADSQSQQSIIISCDRLFREVSLTCPASLGIYSSPFTGIAFLSFEDMETPGLSPVDLDDLVDTEMESSRISWKKFVLIYLDKSDHSLKKKEVPYPSSIAKDINRLKGSAFSSYLVNPSYPEKVIAKGIENIGFALNNYPTLLVEIVSRQKVQRETRYTASTFAIYPRN